MKPYQSICSVAAAILVVSYVAGAQEPDAAGRYEYPRKPSLTGFPDRPSRSLLEESFGETATPPREAGANHVRTTYFGSTLWTGMEDVALQGNYAYCGLANGIQIIDIADKTNPGLVSQLDLPRGQVRGVTISENRLYVADGPGGLKIVDISNPANPQLLGSVDIPADGYACDVEVAGNFAYLADGFDGLRAIDICNPAAPAMVGRYDTPDYATSVWLSGSNAYVADQYYGLQIIGITNPFSLTLVGSDTVGAMDYFGRYMGVRVRDNYAYAACFESFRIFDVTNPASPHQVKQISSNGFFIDMDFVEFSDEYQTWKLLYTAGWGYITKFDITDPINTHADNTLVGDLDSPFDHLVVTPDYLLAPRRYTGLWIAGHNFYDFYSNPIGQYKTAAQNRDLAVEGNRAYVVMPDEGVQILDISNPESPTPLGFYSICEDPWNSIERYAFDGNRMCLVIHALQDTLHIVDATDPLNMSYFSYPVTNYLAAVAIKGDRVYLSEYRIGSLRILDISDPEAATVVGVYQSSAPTAMVLAVQDSLVYLCTTSGLEILNTSDPANIVRIGFCPKLLDTPYDIKIHDQRAYMVGTGGCQIVDISNPTSPMNLALRDDIIAPAIDISADGNFAYVGAVEHGVGIYQITSPVPLNQAGHYTVPGYAWRAVPIGNLFYVVDENSLTIVRTEMATCGDPNGDGGTDISDPVYLISYIFGGGPAPAAGENSDVDCSGSVDISDVVFLIGFIFGTGLQPCEHCK